MYSRPLEVISVFSKQPCFYLSVLYAYQVERIGLSYQPRSGRHFSVIWGGICVCSTRSLEDQFGSVLDQLRARSSSPSSADGAPTRSTFRLGVLYTYGVIYEYTGPSLWAPMCVGTQRTFNNYDCLCLACPRLFPSRSRLSNSQTVRDTTAFGTDSGSYTQKNVVSKSQSNGLLARRKFFMRGSLHRQKKIDFTTIEIVNLKIVSYWKHI